MKFTTLKKSAEEERSIFLSSKGKLEDDEDDEGSDGWKDIGDERAHTKLLQDLGKISTKKKPALQREVRTSVGTVTSTIDTSNLLKRIGSKQLQKVSEKQEKQSLPEPLEKAQARRLKRAAGYEKVHLEVKKWEKLVKNRRSATQLQFPLHDTGKKLRVIDSSSRPEMKTKLEQEVYSLLLGAQLVEKPETEEEKEMKRALSLEEVKEKIRERIREREMKRRLEHKAYLQNKSKSRKYHQILRKERQRKQKAELEELQKTDPEAALEKLQEMDDLRIQERMSQRHSKSKWAHFQGLRAGKDDSAKAALMENARLRKELKAKMAKREQDSDEEEDNEDIEQEAGLSDPSNPWTASLDKKKTNPKTIEDDGEESFTKFKKFWAEVNKRKEEDRKAMEEATKRNEEERKVIEEANKRKEKEEAFEATTTSQKEEEDVNKKEEEEEEMEEEDDNDDDESESKDEEDECGDGESENNVEEGSDNEEDDVSTHKSKVKLKSNLNDSEEEGRLKGKTTLKRSKKEVKKGQPEKKLKSDIKKGEEVKNTKNIKVAKKKIKSEVNKEKEEMSKNTKITKKKVRSDVNNEDQEGKNKTGKKTKKSSKLNEVQIQSEELEVEESGSRKVKASVKRKIKPEEDNEEQQVKKVKKARWSKKKKSSIKNKKITDGESIKNKKISDGESIKKNKISHGEDDNVEVKEEDKNVDIAEELTSVDYMFNKAEAKIQQRMKRKLAKMGVSSGEGEKWKKVGWKKKAKVESQGAVTVEEFDFSPQNNEDNTIEGRERLKTLQDVEAFGNRKEQETTDKTAQAIGILKKSAKTNKIKEKEKEEEATIKKKVEVDPKKFLQVNAKKIYTATPDRAAQAGEGLDDSEEEDDDGENPEDIIREAFADDYLIDEFKAEKKKILNESKAKTISYALPGWGSWTGPNSRVSKNKRRKYKLLVPEVRRKDKDLGHVIYNEDADVHKNLRKAMVSELPYMYSSVKDFEASVRAPVGRMFVPEKAHRKLTLPPVITKLGTIIEPMSEDMLMNTAEAREIQKEKKKQNQDKNNQNKGKNNLYKGKNTTQGKKDTRTKT